MSIILIIKYQRKINRLYYNPVSTVTRAEMAQVLYNLLDR